MKTQREALVSRVQGYVHSVRNDRTLQVGGSAASDTNLEIISRCVESWLFLIEDLMLRSALDERARIDRMENFFSFLRMCDFTQVLSFLDRAFLLLIKGDTTLETFKQFLSSELEVGIDYKRLLSPINRQLYQFLSETDMERRAYLLRDVAQFLRFPRKLELQNIGLEEQALRSYLDTESSLLPGEDIPEEIILSLRKIVKKWFRRFRIDSILPSHGSGSVAEGSLSLADKFSYLRYDDLLKIALSSNGNNERYKEFFPYPPEQGLVRKSRTIFVPKTASKLRTISMEPATLQYFQQGVMYELYRYIDSHPYLGRRVTLSDQGQNQVLAWEGSKFQSYGTIDLSHASDSVSWGLIRRVFTVVPQLYKWLVATRSKETLLPNGETISLKKFAPMGSALCFPIQCILFSAIVEHALGNVCGTDYKCKRLFSVYGDDIVVQSSAYEETIRLLQICGFEVNTRKSYGIGPFRESCGKDYYAGVDITSLYYRTPFYKTRVSPSAYGSWCSAANNAYLHRLPLYRWYLITKILNADLSHGPYFTHTPEASPHLYSPTPTNFHAKIRWNRGKQRSEGKFMVVKSRQLSGELADDTLRYFCKLVEMAKRKFSLRPAIVDEPPLPYAMHGCVEYFSSTTLPIQDYVHPNKLVAVDWGVT